jgi:hypothetical protein
MQLAKVTALAATVLVAIPQVFAAPNLCTQFSPNPITIQHLAAYFPPQKVTNVETLLDSEAIRQTLSLYAYIIDARAYDSLSDIFTATAVANYPAPVGIMNGLETIKTTLSANLAQFPGTQHLLGTQNIRLCNDKKAVSVTYFRAAHFLARNGTGAPLDVADDSSMLYAYGQYQDTWEKRDGLWKIVYRNLVYMVSTVKSDRTALMELM